MDLGMKRCRCLAFTWKELVALVVVLGVLAGLLLPSIAESRAKSMRISCVGRLKNIGLSYRIWSSNVPDFPFHRWNERRELEPATNDVIWNFTVISNELATPEILVCPADRERMRWAAPAHWNLGASNISYFVNVLAHEADPEVPMTGDSNLLLDGAPIRTGYVKVGMQRRIEFDGTRHVRQGNVGLADGSVMQMSNERLAEYLRKLRAGREQTNMLLGVP